MNTNINITWMRRGAHRIRHAFRAAEVGLESRYEATVPLGGCDVFRIADLVVDLRAATCVRCERAIQQIEIEQRQAALRTRLGGPVVRPARRALVSSARTYSPRLKTVA